MLAERLYRAGLRDWQMQAASIGSIGLCIGLWIRAKTVDQEERGNAERRALFVGLWPPMFWLIGNSLERTVSPRGGWLIPGPRGAR
jgi:hypothetical protein